MGHLASKQEIIAILRRLDLDGDAKINYQEFGEAIKTQLASSNPLKLRQQQLEAEKMEKAGLKINRSASKLKSDFYDSNQDNSPVKESYTPNSRTVHHQALGGPPSILKRD
jgi:hypothetical protein